MCGRFNMTADPLTRLFMAMVGQPFPDPDRFNVAPTEFVPVIAAESGQTRVAQMRWWLVPHWAKEPSARYAMFNARAEGLTRSRAFRMPFALQRVVVPVSGFYEWLSEDGRKVPYYVVADGQDGLLLAGLWDRWSGGREPLESFTLVTTEAHPQLQWLHHRQPVMLDEQGAERWLRADAAEAELLDLCAPGLPIPLAVAAVDTKVNNARFKESACLEATGPVRHIKPFSSGCPSPL
ncbi:MAG: SOS response-associated peptidase [Gammaproteobacteria bacterium]|nr:SOS response-associated peptidase [Gammaproteobacteria bacterium]